jgi:peptidoglycan/LPS O-acetylase OafA/YrhL
MESVASPRVRQQNSNAAATAAETSADRRAARAHFAFLDGLRGWASLAVVFYHVQFFRPELTEIGAALPDVVVDDVFGRGNLGVAVFFVLSGFVIAYSARGGLAPGDQADPSDRPADGAVTAAPPSGGPVPWGRHKPFSAPVFALRRALRIVPPYYAAIVVALAFALAASLQEGGPFLPGEAAFSWPRFGSHLFFGQEILGFTNFNDVFWTLGLELQFYAVFAALVVALRWVRGSRLRLPTVPVLFGAVALVSVGWTLTMAPDAPRAVWFPALIYSFFLGVLVLLRALRLVPWWLPALLLAAVAAVATVHAYNREFAAASGVTAAVLWLVVEIGGLDRVLADPVSQLLGRVSYSLYLVHTPVLGAALVVSALVLPQTAAGQAVGLVVALTAALVASVVFYYLIEAPSVRWSRRAGQGTSASR